jgi:anthranilate phosphoribosyltransferase
MDPLAPAIDKLTAGESLSAAECCRAVVSLLVGEVPDALAAAFLTGLARKGETPDELAGAIEAVRGQMVRWQYTGATGPLVDTCGTGGDCSDTINISTAAAIVVATCGMPVVKHGNRAASSRSGSSDVLSALGIAVDPELAVLERCLLELGIAFLFAPRFHPGLSRVAPVRRQLSFRTVFNLVGPLSNPAAPAYQLIGVAGDDRAELVARALSRQDHITRAVVVSGTDGLDEVTLGGPTTFRAVERGRVDRGVWNPEDFGLEHQEVAAIKITSPAESADRIRRVLGGERGAARDFVLANSAAALWVTGRYSLREATLVAGRAIDSGAAARLLERWAELAPATAG